MNPFLFPLFFVFAFLYSMVGLGGGSAYVAILGLSEVDTRYIPSTALFLNILVTSVGFMNYKRHVDFGRMWRFLIMLYGVSIFGVVFGSHIHFRRNEFLAVLGVSLIASSLISFLRSFIQSRVKAEGRRTETIPTHTFPYVLVAGFLFGVLAGIVGIGGGVFLSPVLLLAGFPPKKIAGITSLYVLINSVFGFFSHLALGKVDFLSLALPAGAFTLLGALLGSYLGSAKLKAETVKKTLTLIIFAIGVRILMKSLGVF